MEGVERPVQLRHRCVDARLLVETALAAGFTSIDGGGISHNLSYAKDVPLAQTLAHWQYCDRLIGEYAAAGILLNRETYGPLTGTLIPPFLSHAVSILEALLAAEQGVKCITLSYGQGGNLTQDVGRYTLPAAAGGGVPFQNGLFRRGRSPSPSTSGWAASPKRRPKPMG